MSLDILSAKFQSLLNSLTKEKTLKILDKLISLGFVKNNVFIKEAKRIFREEGFSLKTTELYEFFSKAIGEKNWNIVNSKKIEFYLELFKDIFFIATGIKSLDENHYGFKRGTIVTFVGSEDSGPDLMITMACNAIKDGKKVLCLSYDSRNDHLISRYKSNLSGVSLNNIKKDSLNSEEKLKLKLISEKYPNKLKIINLLRYRGNVLSLVRELFEKGKFDIVIFDDHKSLIKSVETSLVEDNIESDSLDYLKRIRLGVSKGESFNSLANMAKETKMKVNFFYKRLNDFVFENNCVVYLSDEKKKESTYIGTSSVMLAQLSSYILSIDEVSKEFYKVSLLKSRFSDKTETVVFKDKETKKMVDVERVYEK